MCTEVTKRRLEEVDELIYREARVLQHKWGLAQLFSLEDMRQEMYCAIMQRAAREPDWLNSPDTHIATYARRALTAKLHRETKHGWFAGFDDHGKRPRSPDQDEPMIERWMPAETRKWSPEAVVIAREALNSVLDSMSPKRREATLLFAQGYYLAEIAAELSAPYHVVKEWIEEIQHRPAAREWRQQAQGRLPDPATDPQGAVARARKMYKRGHSLKAIAEQLLGSSNNPANRQWVRAAVGVKPGEGYARAYYNSPACRRYQDPNCRRRAAEMRQRGASLERIAQEVLGLQRTTTVARAWINEVVDEYAV